MQRKKYSRRPILNLKTQTIIPSEFKECQAFWEYCQRVLRLGTTIIKHCNEGQRDEWYGKALRTVGLTPGVCDYQYLVSNGKYHTLWIEMKRANERERKKRPEQDAFIEMLLKNGHYASYAYGCDDAIRIYTEYVNNKL